jgi:hypothetical protein
MPPRNYLLAALAAPTILSTRFISAKESLHGLKREIAVCRLSRDFFRGD